MLILHSSLSRARFLLSTPLIKQTPAPPSKGDVVVSNKTKGILVVTTVFATTKRRLGVEGAKRLDES